MWIMLGGCRTGIIDSFFLSITMAMLLTAHKLGYNIVYEAPYT